MAPSSSRRAALLGIGSGLVGALVSTAVVAPVHAVAVVTFVESVASDPN